jgi:exopolysaccharide biosynthesis protein
MALAGSGEAWRTRLIVVRLDPRVLRLSLDTAFVEHRAAWSVNHMRTDAVFAVNAGQFNFAMPWGWVVLNGRQFLPAQRGPLSSTFSVDSSGGIGWLHGDLSRGVLSRVAWAFQSYPTLLRDGQVPGELLGASSLIDLTHRDARAAIGEDRDGKIIVALTRFDALGANLGFVPFGLTTPEMSAVMGALGARDAVMLDGGISAQLAVRDERGFIHAWHGARSVPLALVARY